MKIVALERRIERAKNIQVHLDGGLGLYYAQSQADPETEYHIDLNEGLCDCKDHEKARETNGLDGAPWDPEYRCFRCKHIIKAQWQEEEREELDELLYRSAMVMGHPAP